MSVQGWADADLVLLDTVHDGGVGGEGGVVRPALQLSPSEWRR